MCGADTAPTAAGAYALLMRLGAPLEFPWRGRDARLGPGWYVYAGSARGPGGIAGRLKHHLRRGKRVHWHVDRLTAAAAEVRPCAWVGGSECAIVSRLAALPGFSLPLPGFGSSDCRCCASHLLRYDEAGISGSP